MAGEWPVLTLRRAGVTLLDCDHRTPPEAKSGHPYVAIPQIAGGRIDFASARTISREHLLDWTRKTRPQPGDVILSRRCNPGETAWVNDATEFALGQNLVLLRADRRALLPEFLRWMVRGPEWWDQVRMFLNVGAVFDSLRCQDVPEFRLTIPSLPEQRAIARILGALDDKIELNRRTNETLEAMARALFKSWFVDFDPVRAKAEGRDPGLPKAVADLFADRFVATELGPGPHGWDETRWGKVVALEYGKGLSDYGEWSGDVPVYGTNGRIGATSVPLCKHAGVIVGRKGAYRGVHYCDRPFFAIDTAFFVEPRVPTEMRWVFYELLRFDINGMDSGSAIPSTSREDFYAIPVLKPPIDIQRAFVQLLSAGWSRQASLTAESRTLAALRDALLPKLLSGELCVPDAERLVEVFP